MPLLHLRKPYLGINLTNHGDFNPAGASTIEPDSLVSKHPIYFTQPIKVLQMYTDVLKLCMHIAMYYRFVTPLLITLHGNIH